MDFPRLSRRPDWRARLSRYLWEASCLPFAYGRHDCAQFAGGAVGAVTGHNPAAVYAGRYTTPRGALRILRRDGFDSWIDCAMASCPPRLVTEARPGDLAVIDVADGPALGVVQGQGVYALSDDPARPALRLWPLDVANAVLGVG